MLIGADQVVGVVLAVVGGIELGENDRRLHVVRVLADDSFQLGHRLVVRVPLLQTEGQLVAVSDIGGIVPQSRPGSRLRSLYVAKFATRTCPSEIVGRNLGIVSNGFR